MVHNRNKRPSRLTAVTLLECTLAVLLKFVLFPSLGLAQLIPDTQSDRNLGTTVRLRTAQEDVIEGGTLSQNGANLFHSFLEFNVGAGRRVYFANPNGVRNILSRVTGTNPSTIRGVLGVNGPANLFLLNPNGIVFGNGASLDVRGAFVATTADAIQFGAQGSFSALPTAGETPSLLAIAPSALQFNRAASQPAAPISIGDRQSSRISLRVPDGQSLLLVGGDLRFEQANLVAPGGRVELGAVSGTATVGLDDAGGGNLRLNVPNEAAQASVLFTRGANINVAADGGGNIAIYTGNLRLEGSSDLTAGIASRRGAAGSQAGDIQINATGTVVLTEESTISNNVNGQSIGNSGNIILTAQSLNMSRQARIQANTLGTGNAGNIDVNISDAITIARSGRITSNVGERSRATPADGNGGNVTVHAQSISLLSGGFIDAITNAEGAGGAITVVAPRSITISGRARDNDESRISVETGRNANGEPGSITIETAQLQLDDGARINAVSSGKSDGGSITVNTDRLVVDTGAQIRANAEGGGDAGAITINAEGGSVLTSGRRYDDNSGLFVVARRLGTGDGGSISINTGTLQVVGDAQISATTRSIGAGGSITIDVNRLELTEGGEIVARTDSSGRAGEITINVNGGDVLISGRTSDLGRESGLFVITRSSGDAGNLTINNAGQLRVEDGALITAATVINNETDEVPTGNGGRIFIDADQVQVRAGAEIRVGSEGDGRAGALAIDSPTVILSNRGRITAETTRSGGGDILLDNVTTLRVNNSQISASTGDGVGGSLEINAEGGTVALSGEGGLAVEATGTGSAGNLTIAARQVTLDNSARISASNVSSTAPGDFGNIRLIGLETLSVNTGQISASTQTGRAGSLSISAVERVDLEGFGRLSVEATNGGNAGNLSIETGQLTARDGARVSVSSTASGTAGGLTVIARDVVLRNGSRLTAETVSGSGGNIVLQVANALRLQNNSDISASTQTGDGGQLTLNADRTSTNLLQLDNSSRLSVRAIAAGGNAGDMTINARQLTIRDIAGIEEPAGIFASTEAGEGGSIRLLNLERLQLTNGRISASTRDGTSGALEINANGGSIALNGTGGLFVEATGTGSAGNLTLNARRLTIQNNAQISASNVSAQPQGRDAARQGNIALRGLNTLLVDNGQISASTQTGRAGNLEIEAADTVQLQNGARLSVEARNGGTAGNLNLFTRQFSAQNRSEVTVSSPQGQAGNLGIRADAIALNNSRLTAETGSRSADQANIRLQDLERLSLRNGSRISARATSNQNANGGNIDIDARNGFVVAVPAENSDIVADAGLGNGGNITIAAQGIYGLTSSNVEIPISEINASSQFGVDGQIEIITPGVDPSQGLVELPVDVVDASRLIAQSCSNQNEAIARQQGEFIITGRGGLPLSPEEPLSRDAVLTDWVTSTPAQEIPTVTASLEQESSAVDTSVVEAQGWALGTDGQVILTTQAPAVTPSRTALIAAACHTP